LRARENGIEDSWISAAQNSPAYKFVKTWGLALPLHPEYRTIPMMYYVPPLSPIVSVIEEDLFKLDLTDDKHDFEMFDRLDAARLPVKYLANLFSVGNEAVIADIMRKLLAIRIYAANQSTIPSMRKPWQCYLRQARMHGSEAIYKLTTQSNMAETSL
jgi:nitrate reductase beta subunit